MQFAELQFLHVLSRNLSRSGMFGPVEISKGMDDLPKLTVRSGIGILIAVTGNILISLALNLQKLAHRRMEEAKNASVDHRNQGDHSLLCDSGILIYYQPKTPLITMGTRTRTCFWPTQGRLDLENPNFSHSSYTPTPGSANMALIHLMFHNLPLDIHLFPVLIPCASDVRK